MPDALVSNGESQPVHANHGQNAVYANGKTFIVYQGPSTFPYAVEYDHAAGTVSTSTQVSTRDPDGATNDHGAPGIARDPYGIFHVLSGAHAADPFVYTQSAAPDDISAWRNAGDAGTESVTYPFAEWVGDTLYIVYRGQDSGSGSDRNISFRKWENGAWTTPVIIYEGEDSDDWVYPTGLERRGQYLYVGWLNRAFNVSELGQYSPSILRIDTTDDSLESVFGTALTTPITAGEWSTHVRIEDTGSGDPDSTAFSLRFDFDENDKVHAVYNRDDSGTDRVRYADSSGGSWSLTDVTVADAMGTPVEIIVNSSTDIDLFVSRSTGNVDRWNSATSWSNDETLVTTSLIRFTRRVRNAHPDLKLLIVEEDNGDYVNSDLQIFGWGESGFVTTDGSSVDAFSGTTDRYVQITVPSNSDTSEQLVLLSSENGDLPTEMLLEGGPYQCQPDGGDIRAYLDSSKTTQIPCWVESISIGNTSFARIWVLIASPGATSTDIYLHYHTTGRMKAGNGSYGRDAVFGSYAFAAMGGSFDDETGASGLLSRAGTPVPVFSPVSNQKMLYAVNDNGFRNTSVQAAYGTGDVVVAECEIYPTAIQNGGVSNFYQQFLNWTNAASNDNLAVALGDTSPLVGKPFAFTSGGNSQSSSGGTALAVDTLARFAVVFDQPADEVRFYLNGALDLTVSSYTDNSAAASGGTIHLGIRSDNTDGFEGHLASVLWLVGSKTAARIQSESQNKAGTLGITVGTPAGGGGTTVEPDEVSHGHTLDEATISQNYVLAPDGLTHSHSIDTGSLAQQNSLAPADVVHSITVGEASLTQAHVVVPVAVVHAHAVDLAGLIQSGTLSPDEIAHSHLLDAAGITQAHVLSPDGVSHAMTIDEALLTVAGAITPEGVTHAQTLEAIELVQRNVLTPNGVTHAQSVDATTVSANALTVDPDDVDHAQTLDAGSLTQYHVLAVDSVTHQQILDIANLGGLIIGELEGQVVIYAAMGGDVYALPALSGTVH